MRQALEEPRVEMLLAFAMQSLASFLNCLINFSSSPASFFLARQAGGSPPLFLPESPVENFAGKRPQTPYFGPKSLFGRETWPRHFTAFSAFFAAPASGYFPNCSNLGFLMSQSS